MYKCFAMTLLSLGLPLTLLFCFKNRFLKRFLILSSETLTLLFFASWIRIQYCMLHVLFIWGRGGGGGRKGGRLGPLLNTLLNTLKDCSRIRPCIGCFPLCQRFRKFRSEYKWKGQFRFLLSGIFRITSGGGPLISVEICRQKFAIPSLTNRFFVLIKESGKWI